MIRVTRVSRVREESVTRPGMIDPFPLSPGLLEEGASLCQDQPQRDEERVRGVRENTIVQRRRIPSDERERHPPLVGVRARNPLDPLLSSNPMNPPTKPYTLCVT